jgi:chromosome segregation ATPase
MADSAETFQKFEEKIARAIQVLKRAQSEKKALEREVERLKSAARDRAHESEARDRQLIALRREREEVRTRVEKLLEEIDALTKGDSAG